MTISYNWLSEYLPVQIEAEKLSKILTSIGLEVEGMEKYEAVKGGLQGLVIGEIMECHPHPNADKLSVTRVNIGSGEPLSIVCGAPNVAAGQKVVVAPVGTTIYPGKGDPVTMKVARIRGVESHGMICAEDEIGLGAGHAGIIVLPSGAKTGMAASAWFHPYTDLLIEIGLTPNHMDAMSHVGVARDVCAWLSLHENKEFRPRLPSLAPFRIDNNSLPIPVRIENSKACQRYSSLSMKGITVRESPQWMQDRLKAIGIRPINNVVDCTNFVLHEMGQPLHAFDAAAIKGRQVIVKNLPEGSLFTTLDGKERRLSSEDLMICNAEEGMCMAGVFGGLGSGVKETTRDIFLESAWFHPASIRRTSFHHGLRTDAAAHFEKGMDISATVNALKRAALLIRELAGGEISSELADNYPDPANKTQVVLKYHYLKKLSGKNYHPDTVKNILLSLGFEIDKEGLDEIRVSVPYHKPDTTLPADVVEEIMRIDGLDNIAIPSAITISPSVETGKQAGAWKAKTSSWLVAQGFYEILTNSITNSAYYTEGELSASVRMINSLSAELDILRPSLLETGLESLAYNLNRKQQDLRFFEFGKSYRTGEVGNYGEANHLCLYVTGQVREDSWKTKGAASDIYYLKAVCERISSLIGAGTPVWQIRGHSKLSDALCWTMPGLKDEAGSVPVLAEAGMVNPSVLRQFDIKQPVWFADLNWDAFLELAGKNRINFRELPKQLPVFRDLAMLVDRNLPYEKVEGAIRGVRLEKLREIKLFDIFESEKLGKDRKSMALSFSFLDEERTLTDKEVDGMLTRIMNVLEKEVGAEIRK
ncbi:MAG: phenylalanine--tRNA ligase subunit beta [Bacteroidota bacterium]|nr:phenylalanine--tRNA ligase subunit beta [Bacteroidota bacterium]